MHKRKIFGRYFFIQIRLTVFDLKAMCTFPFPTVKMDVELRTDVDTIAALALHAMIDLKTLHNI
jgi:hypothetical protein